MLNFYGNFMLELKTYKKNMNLGYKFREQKVWQNLIKNAIHV